MGKVAKVATLGLISGGGGGGGSATPTVLAEALNPAATQDTGTPTKAADSGGGVKKKAKTFLTDPLGLAGTSVDTIKQSLLGT